MNVEVVQQTVPRYRAFIAYSHRDEAQARRLHRALEGYRIPKRIRSHDDIPARLFPVFRDREELPASSGLTDAIRSALEQSAYLIVLCSPEAAQSRWVNEEVRLYKAMGREDRILCLILSGEPNADLKPDSGLAECFPQALRYHVDREGHVTDERTEPIAGDARVEGDGWRNALLKIIAGLLGIGYDELKQRDLQRQLRVRTAWAMGALVFAALFAGISLYAIGQSRLAVAASQLAQRNADTARRERDDKAAALGREKAASARAVARQREALAARNAERRQRHIAEMATAEKIHALDQAIAEGNEKGLALQNMRQSQASLLFNQAEALLDADCAADGLACLSAAMRLAPKASDVTTRTVAAMVQRSIALPVAPPMRHGASVFGAAFSSDGKRIVTVSEDDKVRIWNSQTGAQLIKPLVVPDSRGGALAPDGKTVWVPSIVQDQDPNAPPPVTHRCADQPNYGTRSPGNGLPSRYLSTRLFLPPTSVLMGSSWSVHRSMVLGEFGTREPETRLQHS